MDEGKVILNFLQKEIEYYFKGIRKEDLNNNFFKGGVELTNLQLNVDLVQETLSTIFPYLEVESAIVEKFRIKVPFQSMTSKPTEIWISRIDIKCKEPINFNAFQENLKGVVERTQKDVVLTGKYDYSVG